MKWIWPIIISIIYWCIIGAGIGQLYAIELEGGLLQDTSKEASTYYAYGPSYIETQTFYLINRARENPIAFAQMLGIDLDDLRRRAGERLWSLFQNGLMPISPNPRLQMLASFHSKDMIENIYYSYNDLNGLTPFQRMEEAGLEPIQGEEALGLLLLDKIMPSDIIALTLTSNLLYEELSSNPLMLKLFSPDIKEIGIGVSIGQVSIASFPEMQAVVLTCDLLKRRDPSLTVFGVVFEDINGNGAFDMGEGREGVHIMLFGKDSIEETITDETGRYLLGVSEKGFYKILLTTGEFYSLFEKIVVVGDEGAELNIKLSSP